MHLRWLLSISLISVICGCGPVKRATSAVAPAHYDLLADGSDFDWVWVEGKPIVVRVFDGDTRVGDPEQTNITNGAFSVTFPDTIVPQVSYQVRYYIDRDNDGGCNDLDPGFTVDVTGKTGNTNVTFPPLDPNAAQSVCSWF